ncbi:RNA polymerase sigma factor [Catalinimonas niigatensis]|uniref:RNA polymerase sigma factor n=1 Tax=Catalinimonas niigatensis TaxID=1397264 RepID=UPI0026662BB6|nr:sigma-70 family RNA polymerase sigma factor [Catalinimonas niigatensis]WPP49941.1 sigma-70 family RNA polymerase sigma factor [Catalinimonas niigatensis]
MGDQNIASELPHQWEQLYIEFSPLLYNYGCKITAQTSLVEDSVHDVFVNLLKNPQHINTIENPKAYLFKSFRRLLINKLKVDAKSHELLLYGEQRPFNMEVSSEARQILEESSEEQQQKLSHAIQQLSPRQREAIYLKFYGNHSYEEVASIMKVEKSALYSLIYKSLSQLRKVLSPTFPSKISVGYSLLIHTIGFNLLF